MIQTFDAESLKAICKQLAKKDSDIKHIISSYGFPPFWSRKPSFETLVHIILEQQVSLASAKAALDQLKLKIKKVNPYNLLSLTDEEMKFCYFSRQKTVYARNLAEAVISKRIQISKLKSLNDEEVRNKLTELKGIGNWTADVFMMMALNRTDCFPTGDIALINSIKKVKNLPTETTKEQILEIAEAWKPYRTIAAYLLWHNYLQERSKKQKKWQEVQVCDATAAS